MGWPFFRLMCIAATSSIVIYCIHNYMLDESTSLVNFQTFGKRAALEIYPTISLCLCGKGFIDENKLKEDGITEYGVDYRSFLRGDIWDPKMAEIDYDEYTLDIGIYVKRIVIEERGITKDVVYEWTPNMTTLFGLEYGKEKVPFFINYRSDKDKCYSMNLDKDILTRLRTNPVKKVIIEFENLSFPNVGMNIFVHYMKQIFLSLPVYRIKNLNEIENDKIWCDFITISNMISLRRRNTYREPCNMNYKNFDEDVMKQLAKTVGCVPSFWGLKNVDMPNCTTKEEMKMVAIPPAFNFDIDLVEKFDLPCTQMYVTRYEAHTHETNKSRKLSKHPWGINNNTIEIANITRRIEVDYDMMFFEEIINTPAFDTKSLLGTIGGAIGMILGFALWQLPDFLVLIFNKMVKWNKQGFYKYSFKCFHKE